MKNTCKTCGRSYRIEPPYVDGQEISCPYCGATNVYHTPSRIDLPVDANLRSRQDKDGSVLYGRDQKIASTGERGEDTASTMQPVSRLHVIRPSAGAAQAAQSEKDNALVERVRDRARAEWRKKCLKKIGVVLKDLFWILVLAAIAAVAACLILPQRIADAEARNFGVRVAIARMTKDLRLVEDRVKAIENQIREKGGSKIAEAALILDDEELNKLARIYLGGDWSDRESAFWDQITQSRRRILRAEKRYDDKMKEFDRKIQELKLRKKMLSQNLHSPNGNSDRALKKEDVERQLAEICKLSKSADGDGLDDRYAADRSRNEEALVRLAIEQEEATRDALSKCLLEKLEMLRWEAGEPARLRRVMSVFDIWPFKALFAISTESEDEKRI